MSAFKLLKDLGTIIVPKTYRHETALGQFIKRYDEKLTYHNSAITDENFQNPSRILKAGDVFYVTAWEHVDEGTTSSSVERLNFLRSKDAVFVGAQGAGLVFQQKMKSLPKGYGYLSMDEKDKLWTDAGGRHRVPGVRARRDGGFVFDLGVFGFDWDVIHALLCFRDQPLEL